MTGEKRKSLAHKKDKAIRLDKIYKEIYKAHIYLWKEKGIGLRNSWQEYKKNFGDWNLKYTWYTAFRKHRNNFNNESHTFNKKFLFLRTATTTFEKKIIRDIRPDKKNCEEPDQLNNLDKKNLKHTLCKERHKLHINFQLHHKNRRDKQLNKKNPFWIDFNLCK